MSNHIPMRKCVGCNEMKEKKELVRVVKTPDGEVVLDLIGKANGRGAYICKSLECMEKAIKNKGLNRALKCELPSLVLENLKKEL